MSARLGLAALVLLALALRLAAIDHGLPRSYVPDGHVVRNALNMARDRDLVPPAGKYSSYPYLVPYALLPIYAAEYALGRATGAWGGAGEFGNRAMEEPGLAILPARVLSAIFGAATAWAIFRAARAAGLRSGAWIAAYLSATCLLSVQLSTHERPWTAVVFFGALAAWASIRYAQSARGRDLALAGAAAGLSFASHQAGIAFLALPGCAWLFARRDGDALALRSRLAHGVAAVAVFAAAGLVLGHAYYLRYGLTPQEDVIGGARAELSIGAQPIAVGFSLDSLARLAVKIVGYDPVLVALGLAGIVLAVGRRELRAFALWIAVYAAIVMTNPSDHVRYLLPASVALAIGGGVAGERLAASRAGRGLLAIALAVPLVQALRFDCVLRREDTRAQAEAVLAALPPGSVVAVDHYGPTPELSRAALERVRMLRGELRTREAHRMAYFEAGVEPPGGPGVDLVAVEELFEVDPATGEYGLRRDLRRLGSTAEEVFTRLCITHLALVERRPGREERPLAPGIGDRTPIAVFDPSAAGRTCGDLFLPTEMDFPLTSLWRVERPGPRIAVYDLVH